MTLRSTATDTRTRNLTRLLAASTIVIAIILISLFVSRRNDTPVVGIPANAVLEKEYPGLVTASPNPDNVTRETANPNPEMGDSSQPEDTLSETSSDVAGAERWKRVE